MEYEYAISRKKPVITFLHREPGKLPADHTEKDPEQAKKLEDFRNLAQRKAVRYWTTPADLGSVVSRSLVKLIKDKPAIGWVKADSLPSQEATQEIQKLRGQVAELQRALKTVRATAPKEAAPLAQGEDQFEIEYTFHAYGGYLDRYSASYSVSWSQIFLWLAPLMINGVEDYRLKGELNRMIEEANIEAIREAGASKYPRPKKPFPMPSWRDDGFAPQNFMIDSAAFDAIQVQLLALKFIKKTGNYWTLTSYGMAQMAELRAIRKTDKSP